MEHNYKKVASYFLAEILLLFLLVSGGRTALAQTEVETARQYVAANLTQQKLVPVDIDGLRLSSAYLSPTTGWYHVYFNQTYQSIDVYNRMMNVVLVDKQASYLNHNFIAGIESITKKGNIKGAISPLTALQKAVANVGLATTNLAPIQSLSAVKSASGVLTRSVYALPELSDEKIDVKLFWLPVEPDSIDKKSVRELALSWQVHFLTKDGRNGWNIHVDATSGEILRKTDAVRNCSFDSPNHLKVSHECVGAPSIDAAQYFGVQKKAFAGNSYTVFDYPLESPNHGSRTESISPYTRFVPTGTGPGATNGWHYDGVTSYSITRGNNVWAQEDANGNDGTGASPSSATLDFNFPYTKGLNTAAGNRDAAITNLFYWNNLVHDVLWKYGFDEPSGNFQKSNMGRGGLGNDYVIADAQDGWDINNAFFYTPADGTPGRMEMFLFSNANGYQPDADFDNGVISHEYGHGWSIRLTGGPANSDCLQNAEQGGEGWSDYLALMLTTNWASLSANVASANIPRNIATYVSGQSTTGGGIRPYRYSYDMAKVNSGATYTKVNGMSFGDWHKIGNLWAIMLWDMTWEIILQDKYIEPYIYTTPSNVSAMRGNIAALKLVTEGLRLQTCNPSFVQARDAILQADQMLFAGRYRCAISRAFSRRGLGANASTGATSGDYTVTEDFTPINGPRLSSTMLITTCTSASFAYQATSGTSGTTFQWSREAVSGISNSSATGNSARINETLINTTVRPVIVPYYISMTSAGCTSVQSVKLTVNPGPSPTVRSYSVCQNATVPAGQGLVLPQLTGTVIAVLTTGSPTYVRPYGNNITAYSAWGDANYQSFTFTAPSSGTFTFDIIAASLTGTEPSDTYLSLYRSSFNPSSPATNFLRGDDDSATQGRSKLTHSLTQGTIYILVASSVYSGARGTITLRASQGGFDTGIARWYATAAGGATLATGTVFNPVGVTASGIVNTATPVTKTYYVTNSHSTPCRTATTFTVMGTESPVATSTTITLGNSVSLTATGCEGALSWYQASDNVAVSMPLSPSVTTQYYARCQLTSSSGTCLSNKSQNVTVTVVEPPSFSSAQSGNWDVPTTWSCSCVPDGTLPVRIMESHIVTVPNAYTAQIKGIRFMGTGRVRVEGTGKLRVLN
ncbi:M36 family metallopeptidase [Spirosoma sp. BT702]|uniref:M36 family metallopeptidase n=1 Tax=Spirosoma profusum TaxID=2771354 RepID=A0A926XWI5_9BACT|nr:M36 family metallopeptidase [Spirosoma profusum]MBD2699077.1 M36 family metallopeptidase [Spirosoma profusum]